MDHLIAHGVRARSALPRLRSAAAPAVARPARVKTRAPSWREIAALLDAESSRRERRLRCALSLADAFALAVALLVTLALAWPDPRTPFTVLLFPTLIAAAKTLGLYDGDGQRIRKTTAEELPRLAQLGALLVLGVWLGDGLFVGGQADKGQALLLGMTFVVSALLGRRVARGLTTGKLPRERCLFLGDELSYLRLRTIYDRHDLVADLVARVPIEDAMIDDGSGAVGESPALPEIIARAGAHRLIIGPHGLTNATTFDVVEAARGMGTRVSLLPDMLEVVGSSVDFDDLYGVTLLGVRHTELSRSARGLKRSFDVVGATLLLIATAPLLAIIAIAIRVDSPGPILFRQPRIGRRGHPFLIFKFRSMIDGADKLKDGLRDRNEAHGLFKIDRDPRITRIGSILRRTSLDELPQIFNVLIGEMSLVGPRPLIADEDGRILGVRRRGRLRLTPGMTGPWQIAGSSRIPLEDMVKLDHLYVSNWTLWADVKILMRTVPYVLGRHGQ
jgi:exopolysaccharide biosynthesis polyprenyl glycosylphosphotransferase